MRRNIRNLGDRANLIRIEHRLHDEAILDDANGGETALRPDRHLGDADLARLDQRLAQQLIRVVPRLIGR